MKVAVIDCGTNTFHLLIVEIEAKRKFKIILKENVPVKLGEGGITNKIISESAFQRGIIALRNFSNIIRKNNSDKIYAYATAAIRNASNGNDFLQTAIKDAQIEIRIIDGAKEAELIYFGVRQAVNLTEEKVLIMDIGGGSVEFIIADKNEIFWKQSFELGAAVLLEKFKPSDPIKPSETEDIKIYLEKELQPLLLQLQTSNFKPQTLIGSSGAFETFTDLISWHFPSPRVTEKQTEYEIRWDEFFTIHQQLIYSTSKDRMNMKGMIEMRVDMIVIASILVTFIIEKVRITKIKLSTFALKEGVLFEVIREIENEKLPE